MTKRNLFGFILASVTSVAAVSSPAFATDTNVGNLTPELGCVATAKSGGMVLITCIDGRMFVRAGARH